MLKLVISNADDAPIYEQISRQIKSQIITGELEAGELLPSIRQLARELQISVITSKRAYEELEKEGFIDTVTGKGSFVAVQNQEILQERRLRQIENILAEAVREAQLLKISREEVMVMLRLLYGEEQ